MPIYEFDCTECGHGFERLQRLSDPDPEQCPGCGKPTVKRRISAPSFRLAGSGWYETDFKSDKDTRRNLAGKEEGGASGSTSSATATSTSESKPAAAPAAPAPSTSPGAAS
ncbi:FmdB family zinc ribbon protein [Pseudofulvimonas gallinarii]|jgi:putative FmdB family regulatory protein|uniref:Putative FmdB family regulatory protein n=1 Tax=Pseudofulvimonas gallinarii TaxID=634155 RepID=A0A4R3LHI8_9GAMM|nr:zinc ribbon domain-containing protein [Pseudofulvimonas gallinarii]TCS99681.1 putative FmdB family regulatory protein [Pseudofulvimonas gallinarii]THD15281.1 transcriptional regulator [Pseudofulvimonas gallinarii]